jgi:hypothetical protein
MLRQTLRFVALILVCSSVSLLAQEPSPEQGSSPGEHCNGGQCVTVIGGQLVTLNCPTSGGPVCAPGQACGCFCRGGVNGVNVVNSCTVSANPSPEPIESPFDTPSH